MRLIDADKYKADLWVGHEYLDEDTMLTATNILDSQPTIEAEPVRHGRWLKDGDFLICLECESEINIKNSLGVENKKNYCPNCGAKMVGE